MDVYKPIDLNEVNELIAQSKKGDTEATEKLVQGNFPLIKVIVKKYLNKGVDYDDLYQLGCVGFLKAIKNFDASSFKAGLGSSMNIAGIAGNVLGTFADDRASLSGEYG